MIGTASSSKNLLSNLVDFVCFVYHEARNIRFPIKEKRVGDPEKYAKLISLPCKKFDAWKHMRKLREKASRASTAKDALAVFEHAYGLGMEELQELYQAPIWKDSTQVGGNKWAAITRKVVELVEGYDTRNEDRGRTLLEELTRMEHNTGLVGRKVDDLNQSL